MKRITTLLPALALGLLAAVMLCACDDDDRKDYVEECKKGDYDGAWEEVRELKEEKLEARDDYENGGKFFTKRKRKQMKKSETRYLEAFDYVLRAQATDLISKGDAASARALSVLLGQLNFEDILTANYAVSIGDPKKRDAQQKKQKYIDEFALLAVSLQNNEAIDVLLSHSTLASTELLEHLIAQNNSQSSDKVVAQLVKESSEKPKPSPGVRRMSEYQNEKNDIEQFRSYNARLNKMLDKALTVGNLYLAQKLLTLYTDTPVEVTGSGENETSRIYKGDPVNYYSLYLDFDRSEYEAARAKCQSAKP